MRFNDNTYIDNFNEFGVFPKIHNDIYFTIIKNIKDNQLTVFDLGSCTGLLTIRLSNCFKKVVGIELKKDDIEKSLTRDNVTYVNMKLNAANINDLINQYNPELLVCRRVLPEISDNVEQHIVDFSNVITKHKIKYLAIEGRQVSNKSTHLLSSVEKEISYFKSYIEIDRYKNVSILKYNESV